MCQRPPECPRTAYDEIPPRVDDEATPKAHDLMPVFESLEAWSERHILKPEPTASGDSPVRARRAPAARPSASST